MKAKIGLACAGGVVEGAFYEIGALCALEEAIEGLDLNALDVYVGVSSGSMLAAFLASGITAREMALAAVGEADSSLNMQPEVIFRPAWDEFGRRMAGAPRAAWAAFRAWASRPYDISLMGSVAELGALVPTGLFDNRPIERWIAHLLEQRGFGNHFDDIPAELRIVAMDVDSAAVVCFGDADWRHVPISKAVQASTALPVLYKPVDIDGRQFIDGVARRTVHASQALESGADLVFALNPIVPIDLSGDEPGEHLSDRGLPSVLSQTFRSLVYSRMATGFRNYQHKYPDAYTVLLEPRWNDRELFFSNIFSFSNRRSICEHAYQSTREFLLAQSESLAPVLEKRGLRLRIEDLAETDRLLFPPDVSPRTVVREADRALNRLRDALDRLESRNAAAAL